MARNLRKLFGLGLGVAALAGLAVSCQSYELEEVTPKAFGAVKNPVPITGKMELPYIMLVVDKSGSMLDPVPNSTSTKWDALLDAFANPSSGFLPQSRDLARFGLTFFPSDQGTGCGAGSVLVPLNPSNNNVDEIMSRLDSNDPIGGTPISPTLRAVLQSESRLANAEPGRMRFVMLLTDGLPNCNGSSDNIERCAACNDVSSTCQDSTRNGCFPTFGGENYCDIDVAEPGEACLDDTETAEAISALRQAGVDTFVIGFGRETAVGTVGSRVLNAAAEAGGRARQNSEIKYYQAANKAELQAALEEIIHQTQQCIFNLSPSPLSENVVQVVLYDSADQSETSLQKGSEFTVSSDLKSVEVLGDRCSLIQTATPNRYELRFSYASEM